MRARRLIDCYEPGQPVEIYFRQSGQWQAGRVLSFDHPGVWVGTAAGQRWFVTNGRHIRPLANDAGDDQIDASPGS